MVTNKAYIEIGGNLGNRLKLINDAKQAIENYSIKILKQSAVYETPPWGFSSENNFYNQVLLIETSLSATDLLGLLNKIELKLGRKRSTNQFSSRTMDIDILFFNDEIINQDKLTIPHERLHLRNFVLTPMNEIAPDYMHPKLSKTIATLLGECTDLSICKQISSA